MAIKIDGSSSAGKAKANRIILLLFEHVMNVAVSILAEVLMDPFHSHMALNRTRMNGNGVSSDRKKI